MIKFDEELRKHIQRAHLALKRDAWRDGERAAGRRQLLLLEEGADGGNAPPLVFVSLVGAASQF